MKILTVIQHTSAEYLGLMEDHFEGRGIRFAYHRPFASNGKLPDPDSIGDGLILLGGGPWGSVGERVVPGLAEEVKLARTCLMLDKPVIGVGLGAQILSLAAGGGASVSPLEFHAGYADAITPDALNGYLPARHPHILYMRDRPEPPAYAKILARDSRGRPAMFQIGRNAFGFSGHPGFKLAIAEDLVMEFEDTPPEPGPQFNALSGMKREIEDALVPIMTGLIQLTGLMNDK
jgi:GMP synthase-like glutamine amidotransferase